MNKNNNNRIDATEYNQQMRMNNYNNWLQAQNIHLYPEIKNVLVIEGDDELVKEIIKTCADNNKKKYINTFFNTLINGYDIEKKDNNEVANTIRFIVWVVNTLSDDLIDECHSQFYEWGLTDQPLSTFNGYVYDLQQKHTGNSKNDNEKEENDDKVNADSAPPIQLQGLFSNVQNNNINNNANNPVEAQEEKTEALNILDDLISKFDFK